MKFKIMKMWRDFSDRSLCPYAEVKTDDGLTFNIQFSSIGICDANAELESIKVEVIKKHKQLKHDIDEERMWRKKLVGKSFVREVKDGKEKWTYHN